jgi:cell division protein FtsB
MSWRGGRLGLGAWAAGAVALVAAVAFDPAGLRRYLDLQREVRRMRAENARVTSENSALSREVRALRTDPAALERAAREELRFVRPGERVYWLGAGAGGPP